MSFRISETDLARLERLLSQIERTHWQAEWALQILANVRCNHEVKTEAEAVK